MQIEKRKGNQQPTQSFILDYKVTKGQKAIDLYNSTGKTAQEWQELLLFDILAENEDGLYTHSKFGYSLPRRNGKNEVVAIRELYGLMIGEKILHTAHRTTTTHSAWERLLDLVEKSDLEIVSQYRAFGKEHIEVSSGGKIDFRTRTTKGGLGEGFDLLIIDEAQEYQNDQESALKYVVSDSQNPQTLMCGTPPTPISAGTVFTNYRNEILRSGKKNSGWAEWSVEEMTDAYDVESWYKTNPSLGTVLSQRKIEDEIGEDTIDFNIQRLGLWIQYNLKSVISENEWDSVAITKKPKPISKLSVGIKYSKSGLNVALSIAVYTKDDIFIETIDCRPIREGNAWILEFLKKADISTITIDGANGQSILIDDLKKAKIKNYIVPSVSDIITAHSIFEQSFYAKEFKHANQESLKAVVTNCDKRAIGTSGGFGYKSLDTNLDIALLESVILALYGLKQSRPREKQKIIY